MSSLPDISMMLIRAESKWHPRNPFTQLRRMHSRHHTWVLRFIARPLLPSCSCKGIGRGIHIQILVDIVITVLCILLACRKRAGLQCITPTSYAMSRS